MTKRKLRVAMVCRFPLNRNFYTYRLADSLRKLGVEVLLYGPRWGGLQTLNNGPHQRVWTPFAYVLDIIKKAIRDRVDVVHIQFEIPTFYFAGALFLPALVCYLRILRRSVFVTIHGPIFPAGAATTYLRKLLPDRSAVSLVISTLSILGLYLLLNKCAHAIIVHANVFKKWLEGISIRNVAVIPHGVDTQKVRNNNERQEANRRYLVCLGTLAPRKGVDVLLRAVALVKDELKKESLKVVVAGPHSSVLRETKYFSELRELQGQVQDLVEFRGYLTDHEYESLLENALVVCLPYPFSISASGVLMDAISREVPVIVSDTPYFREVLGKNYSLFSKVDDPHSLAYAIRKILEYKSYIARMKCELSQLKFKFSWMNIAQMHVRLYMRS